MSSASRKTRGPENFAGTRNSRGITLFVYTCISVVTFRVAPRVSYFFCYRLSFDGFLLLFSNSMSSGKEGGTLWSHCFFGLGFCDIQNNQGRGRGCQPKPKSEWRLITLTETRHSLFWISQKPNLIIILLCIERKKRKSMLQKRANLIYSARSDWLIQHLLFAHGCMLLTYSIIEAKRTLCDVAQ